MVGSFLLLFKIQILVYFLRKNCDPSLPLLKKITPSFEILSGPLFENLVGDSTTQEKGGAHYVGRLLLKNMFKVLLRSHLTFFGTSGYIKSHEE